MSIWPASQILAGFTRVERIVQRAAVIVVTVALAFGMAAPGAEGERSADSTVRFVAMASPAGPGSMAPRLARTPAGDVLLSWLEPAANGHYALQFATLTEDHWSAARRVAEGGDWYLNWADTPSVIPVTATDWVAHWLVKQAGGSYAYEIAITISRDAGATWSQPFTPHDDHTPTEHGFVTLFPWYDGFGALWLDGRQTVNQTVNQTGKQSGQQAGGMVARFAHYGFDGVLRGAGELDGLVCDCCATDVAIASGGPVATYRNRTDREIRDIAVSRFAGGGWQTPVILGNDQWQIAGCPVNGPAIAARGDRVVVAWYTAPNQQRRVQLAWSRDGGRTFGAPVVVEAGAVNGYVDVVLPVDDMAVVSWTGKAPGGQGHLRLRRVPAQGSPGPVQVVAEGEMGRGSGSPQLSAGRDRLVHAWTRPGEPSQVLTAWSLLK
ncbi:MAG: sialidase family protein [Gammaproteobacteria bacterium]